MGETEKASPVDRAEQALRTLGDLNPKQAEQLLSSWSHVGELTDEQRAEVLARFQVGEHIDMVSRCDICTRHIEHVAGIKDPYWRHVEAAGGRPHAAKPMEAQS
jgi:hypothetical protein